MCEFFAQSYLRTIPIVKPDPNDEQWQMKIAIETDLYNMCLLDLNKEALKNYKPSAIEEYQN